MNRNICRLTFTLLFITLGTGALFAQQADPLWSLVRNIRPGTEIIVTVKDSQPQNKTFVQADDSELIVRTNANGQETIARADVVQIRKHGPHPALKGTLIGTGVGFALGLASATSCEGYEGPCAPVVVGFFTGLGAGVGAGFGALSGVFRDKTEDLIYQSTTLAPEPEIHHGLGYLYMAPGVSSGNATSHFGGGGEYLLYKGLGVGGEVGWWRQNWDTSMLVSVNGLYQFHASRKLVPFTTAGFSYSALDRTRGVNLGGGANWWLRDNAGLRLEVRDHVMPIPYSASSNNYEFRVGVVLR